MATLVAPPSASLAPASLAPASLASASLASAAAPAGVGRLVRCIMALPRSFGAAINAARVYETLNGKSDADLARLGLTRQDLPAHIARTAFGQD